MENNKPSILVFEFFKLSNKCNQINNYQILQVIYNYITNENNSKTYHKTLINYEETDYSKLNFYVDNNYIKRSKVNSNYETDTEIWLDDLIFRIKMIDTRSSFLLAGPNKDGFIKEKLIDCDGFYSQNIMNLKVEGNIESHLSTDFTGVGYAEHTMLTLYKNSSNNLFNRKYQLLGCHTVHWDLGDIRLCFTELINSTVNQGILYIAGEQIWIDHKNFIVDIIDKWKSPKTGIEYPKMVDVTIMNPFINYIIDMEWNPAEIEISNNIYLATVQGVVTINVGDQAMEGIGIVSYNYMVI